MPNSLAPAVQAPRRIQRKRTKGWKMPPNTVYVGRGTIFGNPFRVDAAQGKTPMFCITQYRRWLAGIIPARSHSSAQTTREYINTLRGKDLACWCPLVDKEGNKVPCHADVLLEIANA
jgi:hypothetical protein